MRRITLRRVLCIPLLLSAQYNIIITNVQCASLDSLENNNRSSSSVLPATNTTAATTNVIMTAVVDEQNSRNNITTPLESPPTPETDKKVNDINFRGSTFHSPPDEVVVAVGDQEGGDGIFKNNSAVVDDVNDDGNLYNGEREEQGSIHNAEKLFSNTTTTNATTLPIIIDNIIIGTNNSKSEMYNDNTKAVANVTTSPPLSYKQNIDSGGVMPNTTASGSNTTTADTTADNVVTPGPANNDTATKEELSPVINSTASPNEEESIVVQESIIVSDNTSIDAVAPIAVVNQLNESATEEPSSVVIMPTLPPAQEKADNDDATLLPHHQAVEHSKAEEQQDAANDFQEQQSRASLSSFFNFVSLFGFCIAAWAAFVTRSKWVPTALQSHRRLSSGRRRLSQQYRRVSKHDKGGDDDHDDDWDDWGGHSIEEAEPLASPKQPSDENIRARNSINFSENISSTSTGGTRSCSGMSSSSSSDKKGRRDLFEEFGMVPSFRPSGSMVEESSKEGLRPNLNPFAMDDDDDNLEIDSDADDWGCDELE